MARDYSYEAGNIPAQFREFVRWLQSNPPLFLERGTGNVWIVSPTRGPVYGWDLRAGGAFLPEGEARG